MFIYIQFLRLKLHVEVFSAYVELRHMCHLEVSHLTNPYATSIDTCHLLRPHFVIRPSRIRCNLIIFVVNQQ